MFAERLQEAALSEASFQLQQARTASTDSFKSLPNLYAGPSIFPRTRRRSSKAVLFWRDTSCKPVGTDKFMFARQHNMMKEAMAWAFSAMPEVRMLKMAKSGNHKVEEPRQQQY